MTVDPNQLLKLLGDIELALIHLAARPAVREIGSHVRSGSRPGSMPPGDLRVLDLLDERSRDAIIPKLIELAEHLHDKAVDAGLDDTPPATGDLTTVCRYLRAHAAYAVTTDLGQVMLTELTEMRRTLVAMPGSPLWREVIERTPCISQVYDVAGGRNCVGTIETKIVEVDGKVDVRSRCDACGRIYVEDAMTRAKLNQEAAVLHVTIPEAIQRLAAGTPPLVVTESNIYNWTHRGAVEQVRDSDGLRLTRDGKPLYDLDHIKRFAERAERSRQQRATRTVTAPGSGANLRGVGGEVTPDDTTQVA